MIAMLVPTLNTIKQPVKVVFKANTKIKLDNRVAQIVLLGNTMTNQDKRVAKTIAMLVPTLHLIKVPVKVVNRANTKLNQDNRVAQIVLLGNTTTN